MLVNRKSLFVERDAAALKLDQDQPPRWAARLAPSYFPLTYRRCAGPDHLRELVLRHELHSRPSALEHPSRHAESYRHVFLGPFHTSIFAFLLMRVNKKLPPYAVRWQSGRALEKTRCGEALRCLGDHALGEEGYSPHLQPYYTSC